eukprot:7385810-Prymnesium_polylepis.1
MVRAAATRPARTQPPLMGHVTIPYSAFRPPQRGAIHPYQAAASLIRQYATLPYSAACYPPLLRMPTLPYCACPPSPTRQSTEENDAFQKAKKQ